jgi:hypothetical protein
MKSKLGFKSNTCCSSAGTSGTNHVVATVLEGPLHPFVSHRAILSIGLAQNTGQLRLRIECCSVTRLMICVLPPLGEC